MTKLSAEVNVGGGRNSKQVGYSDVQRCTYLNYIGALLPQTRSVFPFQLLIDRDSHLFPFSVLHFRATPISPFLAVSGPHSCLRDFKSPYSDLALKSAASLVVPPLELHADKSPTPNQTKVVL